MLPITSKKVFFIEDAAGDDLAAGILIPVVGYDVGNRRLGCDDG